MGLYPFVSLIYYITNVSNKGIEDYNKFVDHWNKKGIDELIFLENKFKVTINNGNETLSFSPSNDIEKFPQACSENRLKKLNDFKRYYFKSKPIDFFQGKNLTNTDEKFYIKFSYEEASLTLDYPIIRSGVSKLNDICVRFDVEKKIFIKGCGYELSYIFETAKYVPMNQDDKTSVGVIKIRSTEDPQNYLSFYKVCSDDSQDTAFKIFFIVGYLLAIGFLFLPIFININKYVDSLFVIYCFILYNSLKNDFSGEKEESLEKLTDDVDDKQEVIDEKKKDEKVEEKEIILKKEIEDTEKQNNLKRNEDPYLVIAFYKYLISVLLPFTSFLNLDLLKSSEKDLKLYGILAVLGMVHDMLLFIWVIFVVVCLTLFYPLISPFVKMVFEILIFAEVK